jgi:DNA-binding GntR family transcriptional regulator
MNELRTIVPLETAEAQASVAAPARQLVRDRVFEEIRAAIVEGRIAPGTRLTERELCENFGISRTVVREIVRRLESERLVDVTAHAGLRVAKLTRKRVKELYEIRIELEAIIVRSFLAFATDADLERAQGFADQVLEAAGRGDIRQVAETMTHFLRFMTEVADNQVAAEILDHLRTRIQMVRIVAMSEPGQLEASLLDLRAIIAGIVARDTVAAELAVRMYVRRAADAALRHMDGED